MDLLEAAWGIIANAYGGDWDKSHKEWHEAAIRWRDKWHALRFPKEYKLADAPAACETRSEEEQLDNLRQAIEETPELPRCAHGSALMDGAGELLEPPCGCRNQPAAPAETAAEEIDTLKEQNAALRELLKEARQRFRDYAMDVDEHPPEHHIDYMRQLDDALGQGSE